MQEDTIVAQATPAGRGGVAIVRLSGPLVKTIMGQLLHKTIPARQAAYLPFYDAQNKMIDAGIAIFYQAPNSFTGEDILECHPHGGPVVVDMLIQTLVQLGARLAKPGEFSERAFLNGKVDLAQAEAIADLINAASQSAAVAAVRSMQGDFSKAVNHINEKIIQLRMYIEAMIDFTDEEIDFLSTSKLIEQTQNIDQDLCQLQAKAKQGSLLREGITAIILGAPNVGKSSLLNRLCGKEQAIVTDIPGTTRDLLRDNILIDGIPVQLIDTAGLRQSDDQIEQEGIRRAYHAIDQADIILFVVDNEDTVFFPTLLQNKLSSISTKLIIIRNKIDLTEIRPHQSNKANWPVIYLSAKCDLGIDLLKEFIKNKVGFVPEEGTFLARSRHLVALANTRLLIEKCIQQFKQKLTVELIAEELRLAQCELNTITGEFTADDLLGKIFSNFCIGK